MRYIWLTLAFLFCAALPASAENLVVQTCGTLPLPYAAGAARYGTVDINGNTCISGSINATSTVKSTASAPSYVEGSINPFSSDLSGNIRTLASVSVGGFQPSGFFAVLTATASSASVALPSGATVLFQNTGTTPVSCTLGVGSATATANQIIVQPSSSRPVVVGSNTFGACIDTSGSVSNLVVLAGGAGLDSPAGGGGAGGGGGGAVTNAGTFAVQLTGATNNINNIAGTVSLPTGAATSAAQGNQLTQETATATGVGTPTDTPCTAPATQAGSCTMEALLKALLNTGQYPSGATAITASATGTTAATTATLAGTVGKTTYICSYSIRANATAAITVQNTVTGVITATMTHQMWVAPAASGIGVDEQVFNPCVPASATNTGIAVVSGAPGAGGLVSATATGYQL